MSAPHDPGQSLDDLGAVFIIAAIVIAAAFWIGVYLAWRLLQ